AGLGVGASELAQVLAAVLDALVEQVLRPQHPALRAVGGLAELPLVVAERDVLDRGTLVLLLVGSHRGRIRARRGVRERGRDLVAVLERDRFDARSDLRLGGWLVGAGRERRGRGDEQDDRSGSHEASVCVAQGASAAPRTARRANAQFTPAERAR